MSTLTADATAPGLVHQALIYDDDRAFLAATTGFCLDGLAGGDRVLAVTTEANAGLLRTALGGAADEVEFVVARDWYDAPGRTLAAYNDYVETHSAAHRRIRVIGEPVWHGRDGRQEAEWTRYESVINVAFADRPAWILCPYDTRTVPGRVVTDARRTHPELLDGSGAHRSDAYADPASFTHAADRLPLPPPAPGAGVTVRFNADLARMRERVAAWAGTLDLPAERVERLVLAVNEVATNAIEHGGGHGEIRLWADAGAVHCDVTDSGSMDAPFPGHLPPALPGRRGHGLWAVRQVCDLLEIRTDRPGTQVRLRLTRG